MEKELINKLIDIHEKLIFVLNDIAENRETDPTVIKKLSELNNSYIAASISMNPNTPSTILEDWLKIHSGKGGTDEEIRIHIVYNPSLSLNILNNIINKDNSTSVQEAALLALAKRTVDNINTTPDDLYKVYARIIGKKFKNSKRMKSASEILLRHPKFPSKRIRLT